MDRRSLVMPTQQWQEHAQLRVPAVRPTVLVVDDEQSLLDVLQSILEDAGYAVITAFDGFTAYTRARVAARDRNYRRDDTPHGWIDALRAVAQRSSHGRSADSG